MKTFIIQDRETGNVIESNLTFEEAVKKVSEFENSDKKEGIYVPDFYEIKSIE